MAAVKPARGVVLVILLTAYGVSAWAADPNPAGVQGLVEDARGVPVPGALISVFGKGLSGGGLIAFSDDEGRFLLSGVPAGSYTLRAVGRGHRPAMARQITVLPDKRAYFAVSLTSPALGANTLGEGAEVAAEGRRAAGAEPLSTAATHANAEREMRWTVRHRRRSVLEALQPAAESDTQRASLSSPAGAHTTDLAGRLEVLANTTATGEDAATSVFERPTGLGLLRLDGRLADNVTWSLAGLVAETENTSWRMAAEFVVEPDGRHRIEAGTGYGSGLLRPATGNREADSSDGGAGVLFARDTLTLSRDLSATVGARWSYLGFLRASNYLDPAGTLTWKRGRHALQASATIHTLAPGGDLLTLSSLATAPAISFAVMDAGLRAERITRYEIELTRTEGALTLGARAFREGTRDQLVNLFDDDTPGGLRIVNARGLVSTGLGLSVGRRLGRALSGSVDYAVGMASRGATTEAGDALHPVSASLFSGDARFQDVVARLETLLDRSGTRVVAYYRINLVTPEDGSASHKSTRFDLQLNQGLPFMTALTRADWELLLAFRNLFYEDSEGGLLDEVAVHNPPKRIVGGVSVRF